MSLKIFFFDSSNTELNKIRLNISLELYDKLLEWIMLDNNDIAIFDATNSDKNKENYYMKELLKI